MNPTTSYASNSFSTIDAGKPIDVYKEKWSQKTPTTISAAITGDVSSRLDAYFWLKLCAANLNISDRISDYIAVPVITIISDIPNTNGDCLSKAELLRWVPEHGMPAYKTFKGKPTYEEHDNQVLVHAKGVIFDVYVSSMRKYNGNHAKVVALLGFDRTKDPRLCDDILQGKINTYSMGALYDSYTCSECAVKFNQKMLPCPHTQPKVPTYLNNNRLVYRNLHSMLGFETSAVRKPAYISAISDTIHTL